MKHNLFNWLEVKANEELEHAKGRVRLRCSKVAAIFVTAQGFETLAAVGTEADFEVSEAVTLRIELPEGGRAFLRTEEDSARKPGAVVYTNIDRMPDESGSMAEVLRARRRLEIERRRLMADIRAEHGKMLRKIKASNPPAPAPEPAPEPEPEPAPAEEAKE